MKREGFIPLKEAYILGDKKEDIFGAVSKCDGNFRRIQGGSSIEVVFSDYLDYSNDITVECSGINSSISILCNDSKIAEIVGIGNPSRYKAFLVNMGEKSDRFLLNFDLDTDVDCIYDPSLEFLSSIPKNNSQHHMGVPLEFNGSFYGMYLTSLALILYDSRGEIVNNKTIEYKYPIGGDVELQNGWVTHYFRSVGSHSFVIPSGFSKSAQYLIVGGGGGGGFSDSYCGGGGGGGGFLNGMINLAQSTLSIGVGDGGDGSTKYSSAGGNGGNSYIGNTIGYGGGGGGSGVKPGASSEVTSPTSGGSGGGGGSQILSRTKNGAGGVSNQGHSGGNGLGHDTDSKLQGGGGGGGAGSAGYNGATNKGGDGGSGKSFLGVNYSAGGGGGKRGVGGLGGGLGGSGVGGNGGFMGNGSDALDNSGSGGGGSAWGSTATLNGGNGGSGIVIIRYDSLESHKISSSYESLEPGSYRLVLKATTKDSSYFQTSTFFSVLLHSHKQRYLRLFDFQVLIIMLILS